MQIFTWALLALLLTSATASAQSPFSMGGVTAQPGTVAAGTFRIAARTGDNGTEIPF